MKRFIIATLVMGIALLGLQAQAQANLLTDPGFDSTPVQNLGWSTTPWYGRPDGGRSAVTDAEAQSPSHSAVLKLLGTGADWSMVAQYVPITPDTTYVASASFLRRASIDPAWAFFKIEWQGSGGTSVSPTVFDNSDSADVWLTKSYDQFIAPTNATGANYIIIYETDGGADPADIFIDDTYFDAIPEPATMLLFGSGLVGLFGFSRRKRS